MKNTITALFFVINLTAMAQEQLNDYKYIVVPKRFAEFKRENQYQTSTLIKYLFTEKGFEAVYEDKLPQELKENRCLGLRAKLVDGSSMFTTKASVKLENCSGEEVFTTKEGRSKKKDYKESYGEALRGAFKSFDVMSYAYNGKAENSGPITVSMKNDVKNLDEEKLQTRSSVNRPDAMVEQEATRENQRYVDRRPVPSNLKKAEQKENMIAQEDKMMEAKNQPTESIDKMVVQTATREQQSYEDRTPRESDMKQGEDVAKAAISKNQQSKGPGLASLSSATLYAQELPNGYQLVDSTPKIRMKIEKTSMPDFYMAKAGDTSGTVFKKNGTWFFEYYSGDKLVTEELNIKF